VLEASGAGGLAGFHAARRIAQTKPGSLVARGAPTIKGLVSGSRAARIQLRIDLHLSRAENCGLGAGEVVQATVVFVLTGEEVHLTRAWPSRLGPHLEGAAR
jgi:hypothetical protein